VTEDVWSERDTTPDAIDSALREMLRERHAANQSLAPARVLNLIVVVDREWKGEISNRLAGVGRYNASRTVLCAVEEKRDTLDARALITYNEALPGFAVMREEVEVDMGPEHLSRLRTIVDPIIVSELPTLLWSPHGRDEAVEALLGLVDVILLDSDDAPQTVPALRRALELLESAYVVDLAWLRTTPWRERLASTFDLPQRREALKRINGITVRHRKESSASALLLAGWMSSRLGWDNDELQSANGGGLRGVARHPYCDVTVEISPADLQVPGLAGVSISSNDGFAISLDRGPGGLQARGHSVDGRKVAWRILGASRGEGGILGEGVRQALLRDPTYGPALHGALGFCAK
jgi:glucose-6-phosphate dehydrogenase assembly protein OpcA